jgi:hypothetical protein
MIEADGRISSLREIEVLSPCYRSNSAKQNPPHRGLDDEVQHLHHRYYDTLLQ